MLNVRVKKALLTILTACLTVLMMVGAVLGFTPTTLSVKAAAGNYVKVTSAPADWSGTYLIVYEESKTDGRAFNGSLTALDVVKNTVAVTISNGEIANTDTLENATFTIAKNGDNYTVQSKSGYYIGRDSTKNGLDSSESTKYNNTITMTDGNSIIKGSGGFSLQFNKTSGQERFRYFGSNQQALALYKLEESVACEHKDTFTYTYSENDEHEKVATCTACGRTTTETVDCNYGDEITVPATEEATGRIYKVCGDCHHEKTIKELPKINATKYTLSFSVPKEVPSVASVEVAEGYTCVLEAAANYNDYTFAGWANATLENVTTEAPTLYKAGDEYTMGAADTTLYAVYSYSAGGSGNFEKVTENLSDWSGEYLIVYEAGNVAFDGGLSTLDAVGNTIALTISDNTIVGNETTKAATFVIEQTDSGYTIKSANGYYIGQTSNANGLASNKSTTYSNTISINNDGTVNLVSGGAYLRYNKSSDQVRFRYYKSGTYTSQQAITLYKLDAATVYYTTNLECEHSFTEIEIKATCTTAGGTQKTCAYCGHSEDPEITTPALGHDFKETSTTAGTCQAKAVTYYECSRCDATTTEEGALGEHNYVDNVCSVCKFVDPLSVDYSGYFYFTFNKDVMDENDNRVPATLYVKNDWDKSKDRYVAYPNQPTSELGSYLFRLVRNEDGTYNIYEGTSNNLFAEGTENVFVVKNGEYYNIYNADNIYFSLNKTFGDNYMKFYPSEQTRNITFVEYKEIVSAGLTLGEELVVNYKVAMDDKYATAEMTFTMNGESTTVTGTKDGNVYVYSIAIAPQYMGANISAVLTHNGEELASKATYSVAEYAEYWLENTTDEEMINLLNALLQYGAAAQMYYGEKTGNIPSADDLVANLENLGTVPEDPNASLVSEVAKENRGVSFHSAGVNFSSDNKIFVRLTNYDENVKLVVKCEGKEDVVVYPTNTYYTEGLLATQFGETFTFKLYYDGELMQTLTYSVNAYAYALQSSDNADMANLAIALYNYGVAAEAYAN